MPALEAIISADSTPYANELKAVERMAAKAGVTIGKNIGEGSMLAIRPIMHLREAIKELFKGNIEGALFPAVMVAQHFGLLNKAISKSSEEMVKLAEADAEAAKMAWANAIASTQKAAASSAAFQAAEGEAVAEFEVAAADEAKASADIQAAMAADTKAAASTNAAAAAEAEATSSISSFGIIGIAIAAAISLILLFKSSYDKMQEQLSGFKLPDITPAQIGRLTLYEQGMRKLEQALRDVAEANQSANHEAEVANRIAETKNNADRQILDSKKNQDLEKAGNNPEKRMAILAKYAQEEEKLKKKQDDEKIARDRKEVALLKKQQWDAQDNAEKMRKSHLVISKEDEEDRKKNYDKRAEFGEEVLHGKKNAKGEREGGVMEEMEWIDKLLPRLKHGDPTAGFQFSQKYGYGTTAPEQIKRLQEEASNAQGMIGTRDKYAAAQGERDKNREQYDHYMKIAQDSASSAETKKQAIKDAKDVMRAEQSSQRKTDAAHLDEESARRIPIIQGHLTNNQHVGAYAGSSTALELQKKATHYLEDIDKNTKPKTGFGTPGSSVKY